MIENTRKQYLISAVPRDLPTMTATRLSCGAYLYVGKGLNVQQFNDARNRKYIILGNAFCTDMANRSVADDIQSFDGENINVLVKSWTGRWMLIADTEIQTDACGLMSAFYTQGEDWCISSSLAIMSQILKVKPTKTVSDFGLTWQLLPNTLVEGVKCMFCTEKFIVKDRILNVYHNQWVTDYTYLTTDEKVERISQVLKAAMKNIELFSGLNIMLALTSGRDSRLLLAAALASDIKFSTYTMQHENISVSDKKLPAKIAKSLGLVHRYIKAERFSVFKVEEYLTFNAGNSTGADIMFYAHGQSAKIPSDTVVIRGSVFEAARTFGRSIATSDLDGFQKGYEAYYQTSLQDPLQADSFKQWLKYVEKNPISFIDIRDRMYVEQRVGGWVAAIEQSLDINEWTSIQIANCRELISVLLSATEEERNAASLSIGAINQLCSSLNRYPYNQSSICDKIRLIKNVLLNPTRLKRFIKKLIK